jgi:hypothetical protein
VMVVLRDGTPVWVHPLGQDAQEVGRAAEQGDEADEAFGGMVSGMDMPPHSRAAEVGRGHRFAAYPRCSADSGGVDGPGVER